MRAGYIKKEELKWTHTRYLASIIANVHRNPKKPMIKPSDLVPLSFDKTNAKTAFPIKTFTKEEIREIKIKHGIIKRDG